jgi:phosphoserine/homoserine phosphotransferase
VDDRITGYQLRIREQKREAVAAFRRMNYNVIAGGDSFNDTAMLGEADKGILFRAPANVIEQFSQFPAVETYADLMGLIKAALA